MSYWHKHLGYDLGFDSSPVSSFQAVLGLPKNLNFPN